MTKFALNLRTRSSHTSPLVYPPSPQDACHQNSSDTLPSQVTFKQSFSFRWKKRRTGSEVTQSVDNAVTVRGLRGGRTKSYPGLPNPSPETPKIRTHLRRSTSSWRVKRELPIKSGTLAHSLTLGASSKSPYEACLPINPPSGNHRRTKPLRGHKRRPVGECLAGGTLAGISESPKGSRSTLPIPPIIISSPTLPDALCVPKGGNEGTSELNSQWRQRPSDIEDLEEPTVDLRVVAKTLQSAARRLANDPGATQIHIFRLLAPITAFLYVLGIAVILLQKKGLVFEPGMKALQVVLVIPLGMLTVLALLRGVLWVMSKLGRSFCDLDLEEIFARGIFVQGERLTEADFIVGNLIT